MRDARALPQFGGGVAGRGAVGAGATSRTTRFARHVPPPKPAVSAVHRTPAAKFAPLALGTIRARYAHTSSRGCGEKTAPAPLVPLRPE